MNFNNVYKHFLIENGSARWTYAPTRFRLISTLLAIKRLQGTGDDLFLNARSQLGEESTETGYPNHKVTVVFRVLLRVPEYFCVEHIELNVITIIVKIRLDKI